MWNVKFLSEAEADMHSLDNSLKKQILKGIAKVSTNPLPIPTGYGKPLGNKGGNNLTRFFKIKYPSGSISPKWNHETPLLYSAIFFKNLCFL